VFMELGHEQGEGEFRTLEPVLIHFSQLLIAGSWKEVRSKETFSSCHGPCSVTFFPKNNQRMAPTESPMMAASPLFSATITTGHLRRTYIGAPSEYSLHSATTKTTCILIIVITNQHHVFSTAAQPQPHHAPHTFHVPGQSHHARTSLEVMSLSHHKDLRGFTSAPSGIRVSSLYVHSTTICSSR